MQTDQPQMDPQAQQVQMSPQQQGMQPMTQTMMPAQQVTQVVVVNQAAPGSPTVIANNVVYHRIGASEKWKTCFRIKACLCCSPGAFFMAEEMRQRKYLEIQGNRLEWNEPMHCCCCFVVDNVNVIYYDRDFVASGATKAGMCNPFSCSVWGFCPTCFDICGEAIVLRGPICGRKKALVQSDECCCQTNLMICGFDNAHEIARKLNQAVSYAKEKMEDSPDTCRQTMV